MPSPFKLTAGLWWRFSRYKIRRFGGRPRAENATIGATDEMEQISIVPARGAKLEYYDPWAIWNASHPLSPARPAPYVELVNLLDALRYQGHEEGVNKDTPGQGVVAILPLTPESCDRILEWCSRWGLLGTLVHRVHQVTLAPHGRAIPPFARKPFPIFKRYFRVSDGWIEVPGYAFTPQPEVLIDQPLRLGLGMPEREPLSRHWSTCFPKVAPQEAETFGYPMPLSRRFWRAYGEPLVDFIDGALALKYALEAIQSRSNNSIKRKADRQLVIRGELCLRALEKISQSSLVEKGGVRINLIPASLLACFTAMMVSDLKKDGEGEISQCPCGRFIISSTHHPATYCSERHRQRYKMRKYRNPENRRSPK